MSNTATGNDVSDQRFVYHGEPSTRFVEDRVNGPRNLVLAVMFVIFAVSLSAASDIYIAQNAAGGNTGADCADAHAVTYFNSSLNWGWVGQIGPGTTVHLCGAFNAPAGARDYLVFHGSGASGNVITLLFERGAVLTAPYWSGGVIDVNANSYVVVDGGANGTIQATANGTNLANQQDGGGCVISHTGRTATNVTVQNLTCANLYIDAALSDNGGEETYGLDLWNISNLVEQNNTLHDMKWAIRVSYLDGNSFSNLTVADNNIYNMDHGVFVGDSNSSDVGAVMSGFYIYGNTVGSMANWDNALNNNHHDWFHLSAMRGASQFTNFYLYNNFGSGDIGAYANAGFFSAPDTTSSETGLYVFNNVFVNTSTNHCWANGPVGLSVVGLSTVVNNTFVSHATACKDNGLIYETGSTGITFKNNILQNTPNASMYVTPGTKISASNYNDFYQTGAWFYLGTWYSGLTNWQAKGFDLNSTAGSPQLTGTYHLNGSSSAAWQKGTSLYSMCNGQPNPGLGALCLDNAGLARPSTGSWDIGAYEDSASGSAPAPATGLTAVVQ